MKRRKLFEQQGKMLMDRIAVADSASECKELFTDIQHFLNKWSHLHISERLMMNDALVAPLRKLISEKMPNSEIASRPIWHENDQ